MKNTTPIVYVPTGVWIFLGLLGLFLIPAFVMAIYSTVQVNNILNNGWWSGAGITPECDCCFERQQALNVWNGFNGAINILSNDPNTSTEIIASYFAPLGQFALPFPPTPFVGPQKIYDFFIGYALNPGETNQTVVDRQINWDCLTQTLCVQRTWYATLTQPRVFTPNSTVPKPVGFTYSQDDFVIMRFNCDYKIGNGYGSVVYYREYYDNSQFESTYSDLLTPVCPVRQLCNPALM